LTVGELTLTMPAKILGASSNTVDRAVLHRESPDVPFHDFEPWVKTQGWNALGLT
jgi:hypothetical protein